MKNCRTELSEIKFVYIIYRLIKTIK